MPDIDFRQLFDRLPSPYMILDRNCRYVAANGAYEAAVMRSAEELVGRNLFDIFPNDGPSGVALRESFERVFATGEADTIAYIPYDIPRPQSLGGGMEKRYWTAVHTPLTNRDGEVAYLAQNTVDVTEMVRLREAASLPYRSFSGETQLVERAREAETAHRSLLAESAEFRRMFEQAPGFIAVLSGPDHVFTFANDAYVRLIGGREVIGKAVGSALPEVAGQGFIEMLDHVYSSGETRSGEGTRIVLQTQHGEMQERFLDFSYDAVRDLDGLVTGVFVQGMDRTEAVRTLKHQRLLLDELNHRVKNTLATVQSMAKQTLRAAPNMQAANDDLEGRIIALSKAHNLLSQTAWDSTTMSDLVDHEFAHLDRARLAASGPDVLLNPKASIAIAMVLHELSTNAAKYGALSGDEGRLDVVWQVGADGDLVIDWHETGRALSAPPSKAGFGSRMINAVVRGELDGSVNASYETDGLVCKLVVPQLSYIRTRDHA
ncbi:PAS domain-containing protein [Aliihoeflea aestuarii]|jgi:PAS domain S-box-containing protein|uniref:sensor histidine kinase n=1 Tax=Aliihoeflea aestuarii TaxID=453840 RepID=UPI002094CC26|nr:HWE histidine kinase domain-containing protein [Aliihoeflea aestuarii]MCO6392221.1 PAS domain-containing protein [Aliihoeflea aestuarii]